MNGSSDGSEPLPVGGGAALGVALGVAQPAIERGLLEDLALLRRRALDEDLVDLRERRVEGLTLLGPFDQGGDLDELEVAGHRLVDVQVGVEPHLAEPAADPRDRVEQLVAHDPEGRVETLGRPEELLLELLLLDGEHRERLLVVGRGPRRDAGLGTLGPGEHEALAGARHRHVQQPAHLRLVLLASAPGGEALLQELVGHAVGRRAERSRHARGRQAQHEDVVELEALGRVHRHHLDRRSGRDADRLVLAQARFRDGGEVTREVARGRLWLAAHVGGGQLRQLGDVPQPLDGVGLGGEHLLAAEADALDQAQDEGVGAAVLEGARGRAIEPQEGAGAVTALLGELRALERGGDRARHVELAPPGELREPRHVHGAQLDGRSRQRAHDGARVGRVGERAQPGEHVADLGSLEVGGGAAGASGQRALLERGCDRRSLCLDRAHQHADLVRRRPGGDQLLGLRCDGLRLGALGAAAPEADAPAARALQLLRYALGQRVDHRGRCSEDAPAGAVVALEADDGRLGELALEVEQVLLRRAPEAVDRLVVVADDGDVAVLLDEQPQQHPLGEVRVLVLVDEHVPVAARDPLTHVRALVQQPERLQDQVAEVERAAVGQEAVVVGVEAGELELAVGMRPRGVALGAGGEPFGVAAVVGRRDHLVLEPVDPRHEAREQWRRVAADLVMAQGQLTDALEQQGEPVRRRDRREEGVDAGLECLVLQQSRAERVEGRDVELLVGRLDQRLEPLAHLGGRG